MSKRRRRKSKSGSFSVKKKRSGLRTFIETFMGVAIGMLILAFVGWWYFLRVPPEPIEVANESKSSAIKDNVIADTASYELIRDEGSLKDQKQLLGQLNNWPRDADTAVRLDTLSRRLEMAQTILKRDDLPESDRVETAKVVMNAMGQIYGISNVERLDRDGTIYQRFLKISREFERDPDPTVRKEALLSKAKAVTYELTTESQVKDIEQIISSLKGAITEFPDDQLVASTARLMSKRVKAIDLDSGFQVMREIINTYGTGAGPAVSAQLRLMKDEILLADSGISKAAKEAAATKQFDKYVEKLGKLSDRTETGIDVVNRIYRAISFFEASGRHDLAMKILKRMQATAAQRTDKAAKEQALRICRSGLIRNSQVGKPMDLSDVDNSGNQIFKDKFKDVPTLLAYYSPNHPSTPSMLSELSKLHGLVANTGVRIVTISVEAAKVDLSDSAKNVAWDNISSTPDNPSEIFKRCPVTHVPFFALVNRQGELAFINVPASALKTRIELLASDSNTNQPVGKGQPNSTNAELN